MLLAQMMMTAAAAPVDAAAAGATATRFINASGAAHSMKTSAPRLLYIEPSAAQPQAADYYVFDTGDCFVVVAGDDRAQDVLAYGDGALDMASLPCNLQWMLDHYKQQVEYLHAHPGVQVEAPFTSSTVVKPLLTCTWSQGTPYNDQAPTYRGEHCVTGCIATAMAQVMYYWKYPDDLPELPAYTSRTYRLTVPALSGTTLNWDDMIDGYYWGYNDTHAEAVATLMRYCGQGSSMDYGTDGSGSGCWNQLVAMQMFGYNLSAQLLHRDDYATSEWNDMMLEDLADGIPILYSGSGEAGGHAYVVDGFDGIKYHINWGWEGSGNGYFALDAFTVGNMDFSYNQEMQHHLYPENYSSPYDIEVDGVCYNIKGNEATVTYRTPALASYQGEVLIPAQIEAGGVTCYVTAIGNNAFRGCSRLTGVSIPPTVRRIGKYAFMDCLRLTRVTLPDGVVSIEYGAFQNCVTLASLSLGSGLKDIDYWAFSGCSRLSQLHAHSGLKRIGDYAFIWCDRLASLTINSDPDINLDDYDYDGCEIGYGAFAGCSALRKVDLGDGVDGIGALAFYDCYNLEQVTLGATMDHIDTLAFNDCLSLSLITAKSELPPILTDVNCFDDYHYAAVTVAVPAFARDNYICDELWTRFEHIVNIEDLVTPGDVNRDGEITIADVNAALAMILEDAAEPAGDVNGDGEVNIADVNALIDLVLAQ